MHYKDQCFSKVEIFLKVSWALILLVIFVYWSVNAIMKYISQPVATEIKFKFGDNDTGYIGLPAFTVCLANDSGQYIVF